jgi:haloacetate dehalogenase
MRRCIKKDISQKRVFMLYVTYHAPLPHNAKI